MFEVLSCGYVGPAPELRSLANNDMDPESSTTGGGSDLDSNKSWSSSASSNYSLTTPSGVPSAQALIRNMKSTLESLDVRITFRMREKKS